MVVAAATLITLVFAFFAAAAISRFRLRGATAFLVLILVVQMVPGTALIIPLYLMLDNLHLINSYFGLILVYAGATLPFTIWVLRGFVMGVPIELEEAAQVDGASRFGAFWRILLPLVLPGLISSGIFAFITAWNDFLVANLIMQTNSHQTLPVWLFSFETNVGIDYGGLMAGCTIMAIPVVIFFLFAQRRIVSGMTAGRQGEDVSDGKHVHDQALGASWRRKWRSNLSAWPDLLVTPGGNRQTGTRGGATCARRDRARRTWLVGPRGQPAALTFSKWPLGDRSPSPPRACSRSTAARPITPATCS